MSNNQISSFEKSVYNFIDELKELPTEIKLLPENEVRKKRLLISCVKNMISGVNKA